MRIGFFTAVEGWGAETYLLSLMRGVRDAGHTPVLYDVDRTRLFREAAQAGIATVAWKVASADQRPQTRDHRPKTPESAEAAEPSRWPTYSGVKQAILRPVPGWIKLLAGNAREVFILRRVFGRNPVDVMHVSSSGHEVAGMACRLCRIPCLVMNMITPPAEPYWIRRWLMKFTMRFYDHISSQSAACTRAWRSFAGVPTAKCSHVWNGVDMARFPSVSTASRSSQDPFRLISVGRLHPMKGFCDLIEAVRLLNDQRVRLVILGEGPERGPLEKQISRAGLGERVTLPGHTESPERYFREADAFVLVSVSHESCPAVVPEAMATGLPVITSDFGPLPEINVHGETGIVVPAGEPARLAEAIRHLIDHRDEATRLGVNGRKRAVEYFSRERMVTTTLALYASVVSRNRGNGRAQGCNTIR